MPTNIENNDLDNSTSSNKVLTYSTYPTYTQITSDILSFLPTTSSKRVRIKLKLINSNESVETFQQLHFMRHDDRRYWSQLIENPFYGLCITFDGSLIPSYPHLRNLRSDNIDRINLHSCIAERKVNGTNIGVCTINNELIIRTRTRPNPPDFPVTTYFNNTLNNLSNPSIKSKLTKQRDHVLSKYPDWFIYEADGEYIGLKPIPVVSHILQDTLLSPSSLAYSSLSRFCYFFELIGIINPIIIEGDLLYGQYNFDYKLPLLDIWDMTSHTFLSRAQKESIASQFSLDIVDQLFSFRTKSDLVSAISSLKTYSDTHLIEGFVLKDESNRLKLKSDRVLSEARRSISIMKGRIDTLDLNNYISKVVSIDYLQKPDEFDSLVDLVCIEASVDYPSSIVSSKKHRIQEFIAEKMSLFIASDIMDANPSLDKHSLLRLINSDLPLRFAPLKSFIDFETEKSTSSTILRKSMRERRTKLMKKVSRYCLDRLSKESESDSSK